LLVDSINEPLLASFFSVILNLTIVEEKAHDDDSDSQRPWESPADIDAEVIKVGRPEGHVLQCHVLVTHTCDHSPGDSWVARAKPF
jgi:hypothetical protein